MLKMEVYLDDLRRESIGGVKASREAGAAVPSDMRTVQAIENPIYGYGDIPSVFVWCVLFLVVLTFEGPLFLHWCMRHPIRITTLRWLLPAAYTSSLLASAFTFSILIRVFPERRFNPLFTGMKVTIIELLRSR